MPAQPAKPSVTFVTIARTMPASATQKAGAPVSPAHVYQKACSICGTPLRPNQVHIPGGFECRDAQA